MLTFFFSAPCFVGVRRKENARNVRLGGACRNHLHVCPCCVVPFGFCHGFSAVTCFMRDKLHIHGTNIHVPTLLPLAWLSLAEFLPMTPELPGPRSELQMQVQMKLFSEAALTGAAVST